MARTAVLRIKIYRNGVLVSSGAEYLDFTGAGVTASPSGNGVAVNVPGGGSGGNTEVFGEVPAQTNPTTFTIAHTPVAGTLRLYRGGARQKITEDYTLSGATITLLIPLSTGETLLADYEY